MYYTMPDSSTTSRGTTADYTDSRPDPNPSYWPGDETKHRTLVDLIAAEGRVNNDLIKQRTGWSSQVVGGLLSELTAAAWVVRPRVYNDPDGDEREVRALYDYNADGVYDPRPVSASLRVPGGWRLSVREANHFIHNTTSLDRLAVLRDNELARSNRSTSHRPRPRVGRELVTVCRSLDGDPAGFLADTAFENRLDLSEV